MVVTPIQFAVAILAAGRSSRMGRPKLLLPWGSTSVLGHLAETWRCLGAGQVAAVIGKESELNSELDRLAVSDRITNPGPERGMFSSIQCAAQWAGWKSGISHWIITLGDQPQVRLTTLQQLMTSISQQPEAVWQPAHKARLRHPVALPKAVFLRLRDTPATDLKSFLAGISEPRRSVEIDDPGLDLDLDTPAEYEAALKLAGGA